MRIVNIGEEAGPAIHLGNPMGDPQIEVPAPSLHVDRSVIGSEHSNGIYATGHAEAQLWSSFVYGAAAAIDASSLPPDTTGLIGRHMTLVSYSDRARVCQTAESSTINLHKSILLSGVGSIDDKCSSSESSELMLLQDNNTNKSWFESFEIADFHVSTYEIWGQPSMYVGLTNDDPKCDIDGDMIPQENGYPGADHPF
jgi:hypothetical protein